LLIADSEKQINIETVRGALDRREDLKGRLYHSFTRDKYIPLFEDAARVAPPRGEDGKKDEGESIYIRLKDANFGNTYYKASIEMRSQSRALIYTLENNRTISFAILPVIREGGFVTRMYFEILDEGLLFYSVAGISVSPLAASLIDVESAMEKRLQVISLWVIDGLS
jgi:hypothetical protein